MSASGRPAGRLFHFHLRCRPNFFPTRGIKHPLSRSSSWGSSPWPHRRYTMTDHSHDNANQGDGISRRKILECMTWAGTGVLWTISGGVPRSLGLVDAANAAEPAGLTFLQISDSHIGFDKPANPKAAGTLEE